MIKIIEKIYLLDFSIIFQNIYKNCGKKLNYNKKKNVVFADKTVGGEERAGAGTSAMLEATPVWFCVGCIRERKRKVD
jgi:hypothetical protein